MKISIDKLKHADVMSSSRDSSVPTNLDMGKKCKVVNKKKKAMNTITLVSICFPPVLNCDKNRALTVKRK